MAHKDDFQRRARALRPSRCIGKVSFDADKLLENYLTLITTLIKVKPSGAKGQYIKSVTLSTTMGPGVPVDVLKADSNK